jgi:hypothetical protein
LIVCPKHRPGLFGLIYFFVVLFYQPNINGTHEQKNYKTNIFVFNMFKFEKNKKYQFKLNKLGVEYSIFYQLFYVFFLMCIFYSTTFLPYGRFYNRIGGNVGMLTAYLYIFFYLAFSGFKRSIIVFNHKNNYYSSLKQF